MVIGANKTPHKRQESAVYSVENGCEIDLSQLLIE